MPQIQVRRGTTAQWTAANPILAEGEPGYDTTLEVFKIGNGTSHWLDLPAAEGLSEADADARYAPVDPTTGMVYGDPVNPDLPTLITVDGVTTVLTYDAAGNLTSKKRGAAATKTVTYDGQGRMTEIA